MTDSSYLPTESKIFLNTSISCLCLLTKFSSAAVLIMQSFFTWAQEHLFLLSVLVACMSVIWTWRDLRQRYCYTASWMPNYALLRLTVYKEITCEFMIIRRTELRKHQTNNTRLHSRVYIRTHQDMAVMPASVRGHQRPPWAVSSRHYTCPERSPLAQHKRDTMLRLPAVPHALVHR